MYNRASVKNANRYCSRRCTIHAINAERMARAEAEILSAWERLAECDRGWLAGMMDGEGHFSVQKMERDGGTFSIAIGIANTNRPVLDWIATVIPTSTVYTEKPRLRDGRGWKPKSTWRINGHNAIVFARLIKPYLKLKMAQASVVTGIVLSNRQSVDLTVRTMFQLNRRGTMLM